MGSCVSKDKNAEAATSAARTRPATKPVAGARTGKSSRGADASEAGKRLGGSESSDEPTTARDAVARAAEERYNKQQAQLRESKDKLKTMSKMSKLEKKL
ncbi:uncharacterized protein CANTADRAFT_6469 [Suhomyces tanzawaensis NRRL Y-17324]|uniref:Uncharacterized protein n=1 Tax=Suhomyces tanzawaensis NRRL Y-17324 TaxID=984487 RepID=A0A1E4SIK4_9ASCO|nr:uncharacterized protein CANTADRAFT_6469 [Suhomyces tanzawaensis NRRL Y-17324]ODV79328.1 hypothetical protein CANTADRAFT_6469 [Suhomyces tanzawaensis NRRL Y-17324]